MRGTEVTLKLTYSIKTKNQEYQFEIGDQVSDSGATSVIYDVIGNNGVLYKEYKKEYIRGANRKKVFDKLEHFLNNHPSEDLEPEEVMGSTVHQLAWPKKMVFKNGKPSGFLMDKIDFENSVQLNMLFSMKNRNKHKLTEDITWRLFVAENLSRVYSELHKSNYYVIDTKPANIRAYKNVPGVALLDCDGFKLEGSIFDGQHLTRDYIAPESIGVSPERLGKDQDVFALSVLLFQLFNNGIHPFSGKLISSKELDIQDKIKLGSYPYGTTSDSLQEPSPVSVHHLFPAKLLQQFNSIFANNERPEAEELAGLFSDLKKNQSLSFCSIGKHGKSFKKGCTSCEHEKIIARGLRGSNSNKTNSSARQEAQTSSLQKYKQSVGAHSPKKSGNGRIILGFVAIFCLLMFFGLSVPDKKSKSFSSNSSKTSQSFSNTINLPDFDSFKVEKGYCHYFTFVSKAGIRKYGVYKNKKEQLMFYVDMWDSVTLAKNMNSKPIELSFDGKQYFRQSFGRFKSFDGGSTAVSFASDFTFLMPNLKKAYHMKVKSGDKIIYIPLKGSANVAKKLQDCE